MQATPEPLTADDRAFVYAVARRIVHDPDTAHDVAQDALLLAFRHRAGFRGDSSVRTWLYRIAATAAFSHLRRERRRRQIADAALRAEPPPVTAPDPGERLVSEETARELARHIDSLGARYREVLAMRIYDEHNEQEAARALAISVSAVKLRTHRAKKALRALWIGGAAASEAALVG